MWVISKMCTFPNGYRYLSDDCGTGAGDDCDIEDNLIRGPVGGLGRRV